MRPARPRRRSVWADNLRWMADVTRAMPSAGWSIDEAAALVNERRAALRAGLDAGIDFRSLDELEQALGNVARTQRKNRREGS